MKKILLLATIFMAFSITSNSQSIIADFENDDFDGFTWAPGSAGQDKGMLVANNESTQAIVKGVGFSNSDALQIVLKDDPQSDLDWNFRMYNTLQKNGVIFTKDDGFISVLLKVTPESTSDATIKVLLDDNGGAGWIASSAITLINDGNWHVYEWPLNSGWGDKYVGSEINVDALRFNAPNGSIDLDVIIDLIATHPVTKIGTLSSNSPDLAKVSVYPNPVIDELSIETSKNVSNISVYNITGSLIYSQENPGEKTSINTSDWKKGLYVVMIEEGNKRQSIKVIK